MRLTDFGGKLAAQIKPEPRFRSIWLDRKSENFLVLPELLRVGVVVPAFPQGKVRVKFSVEGKPYLAREGTGWYAVKVRSDFGGLCTLLYEPDIQERISGWLQVKR